MKKLVKGECGCYCTVYVLDAEHPWIPNRSHCYYCNREVAYTVLCEANEIKEPK